MQNGTWQSLGLVSLPLSKWPCARPCAKHIVCLHSQCHLAVVQGRRLRWNSSSRDYAHFQESAPPRVQGKASCKQGEAARGKTWKRAPLCSQRACSVAVSGHQWRFFQGHSLLVKVREITVLVCAGASRCLPHHNSLEPQNQKSSSSPFYRRRN